jgi:hypothetical protein
MTQQEKQLAAMLNNGVDSFDAVLGQGMDNPAFIAQFDLQMLTQYYTLNAGVYTPITPATLNAGLRSDLPFFIFGESDYQAGYKKLKGQFPINSNWVYGIPFVVGKDTPTSLALTATVTGQLQTGDLVLPFTSSLPGGGTTTLALNIIRCPNVAFGSLLAATSSDTFVLDGIRYILDDPTTNAAQYSRAINLTTMSLFGKFKVDTFTPNTYKVPDQFQNGIVDLPITKGIDKHKAISFQNLYTNVSQSMSIFVRGVTKVSAEF